MPAIKTISLPLPMKSGYVNCYLLQVENGFILIDTGASNKRKELEHAIENAGCKPGDLKLILITHGDFDHTGNAAYLRTKYSVQIGMHASDSAMAEHGDMFYNRKAPNKLIQMLIPTLFGFGKAKRFKPDLLLEEGFDLSPYGLDAKVLSLPGHSRGSIGIFTDVGELFCGDLLENVKLPGLNSIMDEVEIGQASLEKLAGLGIKTIYPGHGKPFSLTDLISGNQ